MAEFEANVTVSSLTGFALFLLTKEYLPRDGIGPPKDLTGTAPAKRENLNADAFAQWMKDMQTMLRSSLEWAQAKQAGYADQSRLSAPEFKVGDNVMLDTRNLKTRRPCPSLDYKNRGPFVITKVINNMAYELDLPPHMKRIHNVFHPWLLHLVEDSPLPGQVQDPEQPAEFDLEMEDDMKYCDG
jgi:hypothetical protein